MKEIKTLKIQTREPSSSRSNKRLRRNGFFPGVIYSKDMESVSIIIKKDEFKKRITEFGKNSGYKLEQPDGTTYNVVIKNLPN